jgi:hypothetical protein
LMQVNPHCPTMHFNYRYFELTKVNGEQFAWFGGWDWPHPFHPGWRGKLFQKTRLQLKFFIGLFLGYCSFPLNVQGCMRCPQYWILSEIQEMVWWLFLHQTQRWVPFQRSWV